MFRRKKDEQPQSGTFAQFREAKLSSDGDISEEEGLGMEPTGESQNKGEESSTTEEISNIGGAPEVSAADLSQVVTELQERADENYDKYIRAVAELENTKKRFAKERSELIRYAGESLARDLLEVVDNLERALKQATPDISEEFVAGIRLIVHSFGGVLERHSVKGESALGAKFDPMKHEALASVPSAELSPGTVVEEFKKAYFFKDKLLRPAQVVVATEVVSSEEAKESAVVEEKEDFGE